MSKISKLPEVENPTGDEPAVVLADGITKRVSIAAVVRAAARWLLRDTARTVPDFGGRDDVPVADRPYGLKRYVHAARREFIWSPAGDPDGLGGELAQDGWVGLPNTEEASRLDLMHGGLAQEKVYGLPGTLDALRDVDASLATVRVGDLRAELLAGNGSVTWTRAGGRQDGQALAWGNWTVPLRGDVTRWDEADWALSAITQLLGIGNSLTDTTGAVDQWCQLLAAQMGWELVTVARGSSDARQVYKTGARPLTLTLAGPVPAGGSVAVALINNDPPNLDSDAHNGNPASWLNSYAGDPTPASDTGWASDGFTWRRVTVRIPRSDSTDYRVATVDGSAWAVGAPVLFIPDVAQRRPGRLHAFWPGNNTFFNGNAGPDGDHTSPEFWADLDALVRQTGGERAFILPISPEAGWTERGLGTPYDAWQATKARTEAKYPHLWLRDARGFDLNRYMQVEGSDGSDADLAAIAAGLNPVSCMAPDGVHLNNKGRKLVAGFVAAALPLQALPPRIALGDTVRLTATGGGTTDSAVAIAGKGRKLSAADILDGDGKVVMTAGERANVAASANSVSRRRRFPDGKRLVSFQDGASREAGYIDLEGRFDINLAEVRFPGWTIREVPRLIAPGGITFLSRDMRLLGRLDSTFSPADLNAQVAALTTSAADLGGRIGAVEAQLGTSATKPEARPFLGSEYLKRSRTMVRKRLRGQAVQYRIAFHMDSWGSSQDNDRGISESLRLYDGGLTGGTVMGWGGFGFIGFAAPGGSSTPKGASETNLLTIARTGTWTDRFGTDTAFIDTCSAETTVVGSRYTITSTAAVAMTGARLIARGSGSLRYSWDNGTTWTAVALQGLAREAVVLGGIPATGGWTLIVENTSTTPLIINGIVPVTTASGVVVHRINATGRRMQEKAALDPTAFAANAALIDPDLVFLGTPINDRNAGRTVADWKADTMTVIDRWRAFDPSVDIVIVCPMEVGGSNTLSPAMSLYTAAALDLVRSRRVAVIDFQPLCGASVADYGFANASLPLLDNLDTHFGGDGRFLYQDTILRLLTAA